MAKAPPAAPDDGAAAPDRAGSRLRPVEGPLRVRPPDPFDLDREGDGWGCEAG